MRSENNVPGAQSLQTLSQTEYSGLSGSVTCICLVSTCGFIGCFVFFINLKTFFYMNRTDWQQWLNIFPYPKLRSWSNFYVTITPSLCVQKLLEPVRSSLWSRQSDFHWKLCLCYLKILRDLKYKGKLPYSLLISQRIVPCLSPVLIMLFLISKCRAILNTRTLALNFLYIFLF